MMNQVKKQIHLRRPQNISHNKKAAQFPHATSRFLQLQLEEEEKEEEEEWNSPLPSKPQSSSRSCPLS